MANPDHLSKLKKGVKEWNQWREENPDVFPELSEADLREAELSEADLGGAILREADLTRADLKGAILREADLTRADLKGANLNMASLIGAVLTGVDLSGAILCEVDLIRSNLRGANLSESDLSETRIIGTDLSEANLSNANLTGVVLSWTYFRGANLSGTDLSNSTVLHSSFTDINLSNTKGLETVKHRGPSSIGIDTFFASKGKIPEIFLRGAGVPEILIEYMASLVCNPFEFYSCFISYSHADKEFARRLHDRFQGHGIRCWLDEHQLVPGDDLHDRIDQGIKFWDKVILCCSEASLMSWWVDKELDRALQKEERLWNERQEKVLAIIPVDLDGYVHSWDGGKAGMVRSRFIGNFKNWKDNDEFEKSFENLLKALRTPESREPAPTPKL